MTVTFEHSTTVTVKSPSGEWFDVRMVRSDGGRPFPFVSLPHGLFSVAGAVFAIYRVALRLWYVLRRSQRWAVVVLEAPRGKPVKRVRPLVRYELPSKDAAADRAETTRRAIARGERLW